MINAHNHHQNVQSDHQSTTFWILRRIVTESSIFRTLGLQLAAAVVVATRYSVHYNDLKWEWNLPDPFQEGQGYGLKINSQVWFESWVHEATKTALLC